MNRLERIQKGKRGAYIGIIGNLLLFAIKFPLGLIGNSYALIAASFNTLSDALSSIVVLIGFHAISKPADEEHQYGHGDAEAITGLILAMLIVLLGFEVGRESIYRLLQPVITPPGTLAAMGAVVSIAGKWMMTVRVRAIGREIRSPSLIADAAHTASDAMSSVIVFAGILFSMAGFTFLDPFAGLIVSLFIIKTGFNVGRENIDMLMGMVPDTGLIKEIKNLAMKVEGVKGIHSVKVHYVGPMANVQMHIEVDRDMRVIDADRLSHRVQAVIVSDLNDVGSALVHVCPFKVNHDAGDRD